MGAADSNEGRTAAQVPLAPAPMTDSASVLGPLARRDFRFFIVGATGESIGVWAYLTVIGWLALELTDSAFRVTLINVMWFVPFFVLALPSGVIADRFDRRRTIMVLRSVGAVVLTSLAVLTLSGGLTYFWLAAFTVVVGSVTALDLPVRNSFVAMLVTPRELVNAQALLASEAGLMRVLGPLLAGFMLAGVGGGGGIAVYAGAQLFMVLLIMQVRERGKVLRDAGRDMHVVHDLVDGLRYIRAHRDVAAVVSISILTGVVGWSYIALMPIMAKEVLHGDSVTLGFLSTAIGVGGLPVAMALAFLRDFRWSGRALVTGLCIWGLAQIAFAYSRSFPLSLLILGTAGMGYMFHNVLHRAIILRVVEPAYHGRVMGVLSLTWGANIFGTLAAGTVAEKLGVSTAIAGSGVLILIATAGVLVYNPRLLKL